MKHCLILTPLLLSSASAFTVNRQWSNFVTAQSKFAPLKVTDYDAYGSSGRIEATGEGRAETHSERRGYEDPGSDRQVENQTREGTEEYGEQSHRKEARNQIYLRLMRQRLW